MQVIGLAMMLSAILLVSTGAEAGTWRCEGFWTGNSCIGSQSRVDRWDSHSGETWVRERGRKRR